MPKTIKEIMREVKVIKDDRNFYDALEQMIKEKTNSLVVVDKDNKVVGLVNAGELIREVIPDYLEEDEVAAHFANEEIFKEEVERAKEVPVTKFMIENPKTLDPDDSLMQAAVLALSNGQMRLPVVDKDYQPIGLITRTELKQVIGDILGIECFCD